MTDATLEATAEGILIHRYANGLTLYRFASESSPGVTHTSASFRGAIDCDCRGFKQTAGNCWHVGKVREIEMSESTGREIAIRESNLPAGYEPLDLRPPSNPLPTQDEFNMMMSIANTVVKAGGEMVPKGMDTPEKAMAVMLRGYELGMPPMTALSRVYVVNGRTELETQALIGLVKAGAEAAGHRADFKFHRYDHEGADVELFIDGESVIRVSYTAEDQERSKQGYRKRVAKWEQKNGRNVPTFARDAEGNFVYDVDEESPWFRYRRDMMAYNACKRASRLGCPQYLNMIGSRAPVGRTYHITEQERAVGDELEAPRSELTKALASGEVVPEQVFTGDGLNEAEREVEQAPDDEPGEEQPPAAEAEAPKGGGAEEQPAAASPPAPTNVVDLLSAIEERHGQPAKAAAVNVMTRNYGTSQPTRLNKADRDAYIEILKVRLEEREHEHAAALTASGFPVCSVCGDELDEEPAGAAQGSLMNT